MTTCYLRLLPLCLVLLLPAAFANDGNEDSHLKDQRAAIAEQLARQESACYQKFAVSDCLRRVRQQARSDRDALQSRENAAKERVRLERSAEHQQELQEKRNAAAMAAPAPYAKPGAAAAPRQSPPAPRVRTATDEVLAERATKQRARAAQAAVAQQRRLEKQRAATKRDQARARRQAERDGKGGPAIAPLPKTD